MLPQQSKKAASNGALIPTDPLGQRLVNIFSHPWHFIYKDVADGNWQTETGYPIDPRNLWAMWQDATVLVGVRFGKLTRYAMLDIDAESPYHPDTDPDALRSLIQCLESIGIYRTLLLRSSDSNGLHLYIPLSAALPTYGVALAIKHCLSEANFHLAPGALESFPNCKAYLKGSTTNYHAHRLPLQDGSFLLDDDGEILSSHLPYFLKRWDAAAAENDIDELTEAIAVATTANKKTYRPGESRSIRKWREDSEQVIEAGWTSEGQTNELLKVIARYGIVFKSLAGDELTRYVLTTATGAPGYAEFCGHQHEIERRSHQWARECEKYYRPHPSHPGLGNPWQSESEKVDRRRARNVEKSSNAIERIKQAVTSAAGKLITTIRELAATIATSAKCSLSTLYQHLNLWHPEHKDCNSHDEPIESDLAPDPPPTQDTQETPEPAPSGLLHASPYKKVLNAVTEISEDQTSSKTHSQPPHLAPGFDFCDRASPPNTENPPRDSVSGTLEGFSATGDKNSLTSAAGCAAGCPTCCFASSDLACEFIQGDRCL